MEFKKRHKDYIFPVPIWTHSHTHHHWVNLSQIFHDMVRQDFLIDLNYIKAIINLKSIYSSSSIKCSLWARRIISWTVLRLGILSLAAVDHHNGQGFFVIDTVSVTRCMGLLPHHYWWGKNDPTKNGSPKFRRILYMVLPTNNRKGFFCILQVSVSRYAAHYPPLLTNIFYFGLLLHYLQLDKNAPTENGSPKFRNSLHPGRYSLLPLGA